MARTILIIDDSSSLRRQIRSVLERDGAFDVVLEAADGLDGFKQLVERRPDVVLCDLVMPGFDGTKFLAMCATRSELRAIPVIVLTGDDDLGHKVEILQKGASDYVTKPFHDQELLARVRVHARIKALQDELRAANTRLEALAVTDALTGLANRRQFDQRLEVEIARARRYRTPLSVVLVDVDHFKQVNDTHGHTMGDVVLRNVGREFAGAVRATDLAARYGGEEFALLLPHTDGPGAVALAERLRAKFAAASHTHDGATLRKTASFGVACLEASEPPLSAAELVARADTALYRAKTAGRDRVVPWHPGM